MRLLGTLLVSLVSLAACGAGSGPEHYFDRVAEIGRDQDTRSREIVAPGTAPSREQISEIVDLRRKALGELSDLEPPEQVAGLHREFVGSLERLVTLAETFLRESEGMDPTAFADALAGTVEIDEAQRRFAAFCRTLEIEAESLGVGPVDLAC